jgi:hypothetical protein
MTLEEYLYDEFLCEQTVRDLQTRYLAPASQPAGDFEVAPDAHLGLDQAKANLEALAFLGTTERFADSVRLLSYTFQWRPISAFETLNVSDQRTSQKQLSPRLVDRIRELNENDLRLYDFATHLFESRLGRMTDQLLWESYARPAQAGPSSVRLSADEYWDGDGWHFPELDAEGRPYRWMARTHAVVDVAVSAESDKLLRVRVMNYVSVDVFATLRIAVNGVSVAVIFEQIDNQIITSALIPRAALRSRRPYARIEFSISETRQPPPVEGEAPDERKLGLAFGWLELGPAC